MRRLPWVGLPTDSTVLGHHRFAVAGEKYVRALVDAAQATPLVLPSLQPPLPARDWLQGMDGLLLTGAVSNIEPQHYEGGRSWEGNLHDTARDARRSPCCTRRWRWICRCWRSAAASRN